MASQPLRFAHPFVVLPLFHSGPAHNPAVGSSRLVAWSKKEWKRLVRDAQWRGALLVEIRAEATRQDNASVRESLKYLGYNTLSDYLSACAGAVYELGGAPLFPVISSPSISLKILADVSHSTGAPVWLTARQFLDADPAAFRGLSCVVEVRPPQLGIVLSRAADSDFRVRIAKIVVAGENGQAPIPATTQVASGVIPIEWNFPPDIAASDFPPLPPGHYAGGRMPAESFYDLHGGGGPAPTAAPAPPFQEHPSHPLPPRLVRQVKRYRAWLKDRGGIGPTPGPNPQSDKTA